MKTALLHIPTKKTDEVNWVKPLNNYLLSIYGDSSDYQKDISDFNKLRLDIRGAGADATGIKLYMRYFSQLELLDLRIPIDTVNRSKKLTFTWYDAFQPSSLHEQHSLPYEKASVLFNMGSLMSKTASVKYNESQRSSTGTDESFKEAVQYLLQAAGVFQFLSENFLHAPSNDLNPATVKFLINLCLSQSQEIFTLKVIDGDLEQKKNSLISKLCKSTANHYAECFKMCAHLLTPEGAASISEQSTFAIVEAGLDDDDELALDSDENTDDFNPDKQGMPDSNVKAKLDPYWIATIQFKQTYYESLSYYFQGLQLEAGNKFGEAIAYLTKSHDLIHEISTLILKIISKSGEDAYDLLDNYKYQKDALEIKLKDLNKDNDLIYHDIIPLVVTIAEPKPMDSAKVTPLNKIELFSQVNEYTYNNFLKHVVPINIHELLSYYSEEKSQLLRNELDELEVSNKELSTFLEHLKLPKALVNIKEIINSNKNLESGEDEDISAEILGKVDEIASRFSIDIENRKSITEIRNRILQVVGECEKRLQGQFSLPQAQDLIRLKKSLYDAANSDARLFGLVDAENSELYQILGKGPLSPEFKHLFKVPDAPKTPVVEEISLLDMDDSQLQPNDSIDGQIKRLEDILHDLNINKTKKNTLVENLKEEIHNDDISDILMLNSKIKSTNEIKTVIFPKELEKFDAYGHELDKLIAQQLDLSAELNEKWTQLTANAKIKDVQKSKTFRTELLRSQLARIDKFYADWRKYTSGLTKGTEFYAQLLKFAENLKQTIQNQVQPPYEAMGSMSLENTGSKPYQNTGESFFQPSQSYRSQNQGPSDTFVGQNHGTQGQNFGLSQGQSFGQNTGQSYGQNTGQNYGQNTGQSYGQNTGQSYRQNTGQSFGNTGQNFGQNTGQNFGQSVNYGNPGNYNEVRQGSMNQNFQNPIQPQFLGFGEFQKPPALPPKAPSQNSMQFNRQNTGSVPQQGSSEQARPNSTGLIYDQPSTYQPNMYNYFLGQG